MSANNTDILVSNETNTTSSNNELNKTSSTDSKTNSTNSGNSQAEKRPHDNSGSYFNFFFITNGLKSFLKKHS